MTNVEILKTHDQYQAGQHVAVPDRVARMMEEDGKARILGEAGTVIEQNMVSGARPGMYGGIALRHSVPPSRSL